jgi:hypothetical protein
MIIALKGIIGQVSAFLFWLNIHKVTLTPPFQPLSEFEYEYEFDFHRTSLVSDS